MAKQLFIYFLYLMLSCYSSFCYWLIVLPFRLADILLIIFGYKGTWEDLKILCLPIKFILRRDGSNSNSKSFVYVYFLLIIKIFCLIVRLWNILDMWKAYFVFHIILVSPSILKLWLTLQNKNHSSIQITKKKKTKEINHSNIFPSQ